MYEWLTLSAEDDGQHFPQLLAVHISETSDMSPDITVAQPMDVDVIEPITTIPKWPQSLSSPLQESSKRPKATISEDLISIRSPTPPKQIATSKQISANPFQAIVDQDDKMGPVGISHSAIASQKLKAEMRARTHKINKA
jgi:hypothetical protein